MIKTQGQAEIVDVRENAGSILLDVNFDDEFKDCVRIIIENEIGQQTSRIVKYTDLFSFMFVLATKEQQAKMIPLQQEKGDEYMRQHHVRLKKDMKEGEELIVNCKIHVPTIIEESIKKE